jgi:hypothetical protein
VHTEAVLVGAFKKIALLGAALLTASLATHSPAPGDHPMQSDAPVGELFSNSDDVPCAAGTTDTGISTGYHDGRPFRIRLCAVLNLPSHGDESTPGSAFYVPGANGRALVNSRVSGTVSALVNEAKADGEMLRANSSFRSNRSQQKLCNGDALCRAGNYENVARPMYSNHQMGLAVDFAGPTAKGGYDCNTRATAPGDPAWSWLVGNAGRYGYRQYAHESWHWDPTSASDMCAS